MRTELLRNETSHCRSYSIFSRFILWCISTLLGSGWWRYSRRQCTAPPCLPQKPFLSVMDHVELRRMHTSAEDQQRYIAGLLGIGADKSVHINVNDRLTQVSGRLNFHELSIKWASINLFRDEYWRYDQPQLPVGHGEPFSWAHLAVRKRTQLVSADLVKCYEHTLLRYHAIFSVSSWSFRTWLL